MNTEEKTLNRPVKIIQVYRYIHIYGKENKSDNNIKNTDPWIPIHSRTGQYIDGKLYISENKWASGNPVNLDLILLLDEMPSGTSFSEKETESIYFLNLGHPKKWEIFELSLMDNLELHLKYDHFAIGEPSREDFKLCELKPNLPVEVKINGKLDFSLTSRRERSYKEQLYIFEYLGEVDKVMILESPISPSQKEIPSNRKIINLIKPLW